MNKFARLGIQSALLVVVIFMAYKLYESIMEPVRYEKVKSQREEVIIDRLQQIRDLQIEYKKIHTSYATSLDSLKHFYLYESMPVVFREGSVDTLTEERAIELGLITSDTTFIPFKDTLFTDLENFDIEQINIVPYTDGKVEFVLQADTITRSNFDVFVFEAKCEMADYLADIDNAELRDNDINLLKKKDKFPGLKVGSLDEPSTNGNWE